MRTLLAWLLACILTVQGGAALAAAYDSCCSEECPPAQCLSAGCHACASPAVAAAEADAPPAAARQVVPAWQDPALRVPMKQIWRPPD